MIEVTIREYLEDNLTDVPVLLEKPKVKEPAYVIIRDIDAGRTNQISALTLSFTIGSDSMYKAKVLCDQVQNLLLESIALPQISSAKLGGMNGGAVASESVYEYEIIFNFYYYD